ncbi:MAG: pitrilysin family protein, partial [Clostridia bacterium]
YYPSNTVITVSGKFDEDTICALIEKYFDKEVKETEHISEGVSEVKYTSQHVVIYKSVEQSHISLAFPACSMQDKMREACLLMSVILGGGLSSRLFTSIREVNGLAYNVFSQLSSYVNGGYLEIYIGTSPNKVKKSCELLSSELSKFLADGVTLAELDSAKAQTINSLIMSKESGLQIMTSLSRSLMKLNKLNDVDDKISRLASITVKDVNDAIKLVFNNAFATTYVGKKTQYSDCVEKIIL